MYLFSKKYCIVGVVTLNVTKYTNMEENKVEKEDSYIRGNRKFALRADCKYGSDCGCSK